MEMARTFYQYQFVPEILEGWRFKEIIRTQVEFLFYIECIAIFFQIPSDADNAVYVFTPYQVGHLFIKRFRQSARLQDIGKDQRTLEALNHMTALLEVEGDVQRVDIRIICIVDQYAVVDTLLNVQAHGDRFQLCKFMSVIYTGRL